MSVAVKDQIYFCMKTSKYSFSSIYNHLTYVNITLVTETDSLII